MHRQANQGYDKPSKAPDKPSKAQGKPSKAQGFPKHHLAAVESKSQYRGRRDLPPVTCGEDFVRVLIQASPRGCAAAHRQGRMATQEEERMTPHRGREDDTQEEDMMTPVPAYTAYTDKARQRQR